MQINAQALSNAMSPSSRSYIELASALGVVGASLVDQVNSQTKAYLVTQGTSASVSYPRMVSFQCPEDCFRLCCISLACFLLHESVTDMVHLLPTGASLKDAGAYMKVGVLVGLLKSHSLNLISAPSFAKQLGLEVRVTSLGDVP